MTTDGATRPRVVFWDFDGTLARRDGMWAGALREALISVGPTTVTAAELRPGLRNGFPWHRPDVIVEQPNADGWWQSLTPLFSSACLAAGVPEVTAAIAAGRVAQTYYRADAWELIDGARQALTETADLGYRNVILSNHGPQLPQLVTALGLDDLVDRVITSALVGAEKPNPAIFEYALMITEAGPDRWMVGDNPVADVAGAEAVGIRALLADGAYPDQRGMTVREAARQIASSRAQDAPTERYA
ncbi:MAG TPA: HAD-IA family hydrolase [Microlunatus sp.]